METEKNAFPRYVRVNQLLLDWQHQTKETLTLPNLIILAQDINKMNLLHLSDNEPKLLLGTAIFEIHDGINLKMIKHNFDTSG